ncbi:hypothetical protein A1D22_02870 [Pasteurellaceae bacterium LFhippo2]|nr:hypothetical protein [Pasteurellaceae bacterium LFhippo2]
MNRNIFLDQVKGLLILLVIIGHIAIGNLSDNPLRAVIYFFHIPLFLAITGYFVKQSFIEQPIKQILLKYLHRLIIPFIIAFLFFTYFNFQSTISFEPFFSSILYPFYHLWYVPAIILYTFYLKFIELLNKYEFKIAKILTLLFFVVIAILFETYGQWKVNQIEWLFYLGDKRFYYFFIYFYFGYILKEISFSKNYIILALLSFIFGIILYGISDEIIKGVVKVTANLALIYLVLSLATRIIVQKDNLLSRIGQISLPLYLWHVLPLLILQAMPWNKILYYKVSLVVFPLFCCIVMFLENKNRYLDRYFYGRV